MQEILTRAGCFVMIIFIGHMMRRTGFLPENSFQILSKIIFKITLPAAVVLGYAGREIDPSLLPLFAIGLGCGLLQMLVAFLVYRRAGRSQQAFAMVNTAGFNIGNFSLPFVLAFLGAAGAVSTSLFDIGNGFITLGISVGLASVVKSGTGFSVKKIAKKLVTSIPLVCAVIVIIFNLLHLRLPAPILTFAEIAGGANAFLSMLLIGIGARFDADRKMLGRIGKLLFVRYAFAMVLALSCYFLLPFAVEVRRTLVVLIFSPPPASSTIFTDELGEDVGLASAGNSFGILCSIVLIVGALLIML